MANEELTILDAIAAGDYTRAMQSSTAWTRLAAAGYFRTEPYGADRTRRLNSKGIRALITAGY